MGSQTRGIHAQHLTALLIVGHMRSIANGKTSMPKIDETGRLILRTSERQGIYFIPSLDLAINSDAELKSFGFDLSLPKNIDDKIGDGDMIISVETDGNWSVLYTLPRIR